MTSYFRAQLILVLLLSPFAVGQAGHAIIYRQANDKACKDDPPRPEGTTCPCGSMLSVCYSCDKPEDLAGNLYSTAKAALDAGCDKNVIEMHGDDDGDLKLDYLDTCPATANVSPPIDTNDDGIPDNGQCGDADGNGILSALDATAMAALFGQPSDIADTNDDGVVLAADVSNLNAVLTGTAPAYSLICARRSTMRPIAKAFGLTALGDGAALLDIDAGGNLEVSNVGSSGLDGFTLDVDPAGTLDFDVAFGAGTPTGAALSFFARGLVNGVPHQPMGTLRFEDVGSEIEVTADFLDAQSGQQHVFVYDGGTLVGQNVIQDGFAPVARVSDWPDGGGRLGPKLIVGRSTPGLVARWSGGATITITEFTPVFGDEMRVYVGPTDAALGEIQSFSFALVDTGTFDLENAVATAAPAIPVLGGGALLVLLAGIGFTAHTRLRPRRRR